MSAIKTQVVVLVVTTAMTTFQQKNKRASFYILLSGHEKYFFGAGNFKHAAAVSFESELYCAGNGNAHAFTTPC